MITHRLGHTSIQVSTLGFGAAPIGNLYAPPGDAHFDYGLAPAPILNQARALARTCKQRGITLPHAAMRFPLRHPAVACVVAGGRTAAQAQSAAAWVETDLPEETWRAITATTDTTA